MKFKKKFKKVAIENLNKKLKSDLYNFIIKDTDFQNISTNREFKEVAFEVAESVVSNLESYILDKAYLDVSYLTTEVGLIDLDEVYEEFKNISE